MLELGYKQPTEEEAQARIRAAVAMPQNVNRGGHGTLTMLPKPGDGEAYAGSVNTSTYEDAVVAAAERIASVPVSEKGNLTTTSK